MMRRIMLLVTVALVMAAMMVAMAMPALAVTPEPDDGDPRRGPAWGVRVPTTACDTVAGTAGFEWRGGGDGCWLNLPVRLP